jgi:hypothetical protein
MEERWCGGPSSLVAPPTAGIYIVKLGFGSRVEEVVRIKSCSQREKGALELRRERIFPHGSFLFELNSPF